jgi:hypothetical protein
LQREEAGAWTDGRRIRVDTDLDFAGDERDITRQHSASKIREVEKGTYLVEGTGTNLLEMYDFKLQLMTSSLLETCLFDIGCQ